VRNDIQALRAAAVLMVIANHLFPERFGGGYVGVDVFFVISGYLITAHLLREADGTGKVKLSAFWARRARRLLPAALLVLAVSTAVVLLRAPLSVWDQNLTQIAFAAVYVVNWLLASNSLDYFAQGDAQTLATHYWSLSVEEQFYIVWPLIVLAVYFIARKRPLPQRRMMIGITFGAILIGSFVWATVASLVTPEAAYFQTTGRAWEFAAGGLLAMLPAVVARWRTRLIPVVWLAWIVLAAGVILIRPSSGVPGPVALIPVLATAAVLAIGESTRGFGTKYVTGFWPVRTIGDVSYSAYLWHWPLIVAAPWFLERGLFFRDKMIILVATLIIAWLSKKFIEDPIRIGRPAKWRPSRTLLAAFAVMAIVVGTSFSAAAGIRAEASTIQASVAAAVQDPPECFGAQAGLSGADCPDSHNITDRGYLLLDGLWTAAEAQGGADCQGFDIGGTAIGTCGFGVPEGTQKIDIALVGDSHAFVWAPALDRIAQKYSMRVHIYTKGWCSGSADPDVQFAGRTELEMDQCNDWRTAVLTQIASSPTIDLVVTAARAGSYLTSRGTGAPDDGHGYAEAWQQWLDAGKSVIAMADPPAYHQTVQQCTAAGGGDVDPCPEPLSRIKEPTALSSAAATIDDPRFAYANYNHIWCDTVCHSVVGGLPVTRDGNHLTAFLVQSFGDAFLKDELAKVLAPLPEG
jgi:peptidoglycan/LPS O-acetylase OafA/YrhL